MIDTELNDKQKAILESIVKVEGVINGLVRDALEEGLPIDLSVYQGKLHFTVDQAELMWRKLLENAGA
jgi:hypothetical protein